MRLLDYRWRSSTAFIIISITIALFADRPDLVIESFLYSFVVPILPYLLEVRNHVDPRDTVRLTYQILTSYGIVAVISGIAIGQSADHIKSRKLPLVLGLGVAFVGTVTLACATQLSGVFIGRFLQAIGGTSAWIIGFATLRDTIEAKDMGKAFGLVSGFSSAGAMSGPAIAGLLLSLAGYWATWGAALLVLLLDIAMRLAMLERPKKASKASVQEAICEERNEPTSQPAGANEETGLLSDVHTQQYSTAVPRENLTKNDVMSTKSFYRVILGRPRVIVGLMCYMVYSSLHASYNTTIPTHVRSAFGWESLQTGLLFSALQGPTLILSPACGWLRDKVGTRLPTGVGFLLLAPLLWLLGAADQTRYPWAVSGEYAEVTYALTIVAIGCAQNLIASVGSIEITCAVDELERDQPGIFGPNGGYSRSYALSNMSYTMGFVLGPLISGSLADAIGYYHMNSIFSGVAALMSLLAFSFLEGKSPVQRKGDDVNPDAT
ncbi:hypothetical protein TruAng_000216 [Truncatella angustata]|nr:hypothetical protein TruAng_000216 [Truncatella angustata]